MGQSAGLYGGGGQGGHRHDPDQHPGPGHAEPTQPGEPAEERDHGHHRGQVADGGRLDHGGRPQPGELARRHRRRQQQWYGERAAVRGHPYRPEPGQYGGGEQRERDLAAERADRGEHADEIGPAAALHERGAEHHGPGGDHQSGAGAMAPPQRTEQGQAERRGPDERTDHGRVGVWQRDQDARVERGQPGCGQHGQDHPLAPVGAAAGRCLPGQKTGEGAGDREQRGSSQRVPGRLPGQVRIVDDELTDRHGTADDHHAADAEQHGYGTGNVHRCDARTVLVRSTGPIRALITGPKAVRAGWPVRATGKASYQEASLIV